MYRRPLLVLDDDPDSPAVIDHAIEFAAEEHAALHVLYVIPVHPVYSRYGFATFPSDREIDRRELTARGVLEEVEQRATERNVGCVTEVRRGTPHVVVETYVDDIDADVVLVRQPRMSWLDRLFRDNGVDRIVHTLDTPIIVVGAG